MKKSPRSNAFRQRALLVGVAVAGLAALSALVILWPRGSCDGIFRQTAPKLEAHLEIIKQRGALAVSQEQIQVLSESAQKVGLHLKTCCSVLDGGKLASEQFQQCIDKASTYDRRLALVAQQVAEVADAKEKGATDLVQDKITRINETIKTTISDAENFGRQVAQIKHSGDTDRLLTTYISTYNSGFASLNLGPWLEFFTKDTEWTSPWDSLLGKAAIRERVGTEAASGRWEGLYVEKRRFTKGKVAVWEGAWEGLDGENQVKYPTVLIIEFNREGTVKRVDYYTYKQ